MSKILDLLNEQQRDGVLTTEGPVLILAGAGSGKTRVLTHRAAYLIDEKGVAPYQIMAITFTNKAAEEMRERINKLVSFGGEAVWVATFHSSCVKILRRFADRVGYDSRFTIYDGDDQKSLIKDVCKYLDIDTKIHKERSFLSVISHAKENLIGPEAFLQEAAGDFNRTRQGQVYREYQARLKANNALDFDDLIMKTVELLRGDSTVREYYQRRFHYIMVDEYQDTNTAQFELVRLLADGYRNLCVVGDDDQSIYRFRGANIYNILHFEEHYPDAKVIKLEQNYRSTQNILTAANGVIANNTGRKDKSLWTDSGEGEKVLLKQFDSAYEEAEFVADSIASLVRRREYSYRDCAILYRTNAQSRLLEEKLVADNIPYKIFGGVNFYARREVKDLVSYLKVIDNAQDDLAVRRVLNVPRRGIGATSMDRVQVYANSNGLDFYQAMTRAGQIQGLTRAAAKILAFISLIERARQVLAQEGISKSLLYIIDQTGYVEGLKAEGTDEARARIDNIDELINKVILYEQETEEPSLNDFLEQVSLVADIDQLEESADYVSLMTLHSAKGLEFPNVYLVGMEDGLFPSYMSITAENADEEIEEERRLAYVGITRAKEHLTVTAARMRMVRGEMQYASLSRFVEEIPAEAIDGNLPDRNRADAFAWENAEGPCYGSVAYARGNAAEIHKKTSAQKYAAAAKNFGDGGKEPLDYQVGDRVFHLKFGEGQVTSLVDGGRDYEVTVDFDRVGSKKMFATFAKLQKI